VGKEKFDSVNEYSDSLKRRLETSGMKPEGENLRIIN